MKAKHTARNWKKWLVILGKDNLVPNSIATIMLLLRRTLQLQQIMGQCSILFTNTNSN